MNVIIVTGTPGTGKTKTAKTISESLGFDYLDVNKLIEERNLSEQKDKERDSKVVDTDKLNEVLVDVIENSNSRGIVIDSHLSHYLDKRYVDLCIVTKCNLKELKKRLEERDYSKKKIRENLDSEIFDICLNEAAENDHKLISVNTDKKIKWKKVMKEIKKYLQL